MRKLKIKKVVIKEKTPVKKSETSSLNELND